MLKEFSYLILVIYLITFLTEEGTLGISVEAATRDYLVHELKVPDNEE